MKGTMRSFRRQALGAVAALALVIAACGGDDAGGGTAPVPAPTPAPAPAPDAPSGGTLIVDSRFGHNSPDPHRDGTAESRKLYLMAYDTLTTFTTADVSNPDPGIATSWEANSDATAWTFTLRDAVFEDGTPVTADDVVFSLRRVQGLKGPFSYLLNGVTIEAGEGNTVVLSTEATNVALPFLVSYPNMGIVNAAAVRAAGGSDAANADEVDEAESLFEQRSLGTGPYVIERFSLTGQVELVRNESYWGTPAPFDRIVMVESESQTQLLNVQSGRTDIALDLSSEQIGSLDPSGLQVLTNIGPIVWYMFLNLDPAASAATANADFREAVRYGLDYEALGELFGEGAVRACGMVPTMVLGALNRSECVEQDLDRARAALQRSGIQNPSVRLEYIADFGTDGIAHGTVSERVQRQLGAIGITVELNSSPLATQLDRYRSGEMPAHMFTISMRHPDVSSYVVALSDGGGNARPAKLDRAALPDAQDLVDQILTATSDAEREPLIRDWQRVLNERGPFVPMFQSTRTLVAADDLSGVESHPLYVVDLRNVNRG